MEPHINDTDRQLAELDAARASLLQQKKAELLAKQASLKSSLKTVTVELRALTQDVARLQPGATPELTPAQTLLVEHIEKVRRAQPELVGEGLRSAALASIKDAGGELSGLHKAFAPALSYLERKEAS